MQVDGRAGSGDAHGRRWPGRWTPGLASLLLALILSGLGAAFWLEQLLRRAGRPELTFRASDLIYVAAIAGMTTVGAVLAGRRPHHPVGWLMLGLGLAGTFDGVTDSYARYGLLANPGALPAVRQVRAMGDTFILWPAGVGFILLLTPTGALPSPRWRWWAGIAVAAPLLWTAATVVGFATVSFPPYYSFPNPYFVPALAAPAVAIALPAMGITLLSVVVGCASLVVRLRRATGEERQQLRLVASAAVVAAAGIPVAMAGIASDNPVAVGFAVVGSAMVLCLAIAASILRYRLYDLDRIVSRTVAYGLLSMVLGLVYAAVVLGLGPLLGRDSSLAVAAATLAVAAVFQPLRHQVQVVVDQHFNRRRHDASVLIAAFGSRLRDQVDRSTLTVELLSVVDQAIQPSGASLWLWPRARSGMATNDPSVLDVTAWTMHLPGSGAAADRRAP